MVEKRAQEQKQVNARSISFLSKKLSAFCLPCKSSFKVILKLCNNTQGEEKKHGEEINFLKRTNQQLKAQLEGIISQKK